MNDRGVLDATEFGARCPQTGDGERSRRWGWLTRDQLIASRTPHPGDATSEIVAAYEEIMRGASPSSLQHRIARDRFWHLPHLQVGETKAAAGQFTTAWTSFADDGDPNHEGMPTWQPQTSGDPAVMVFGLGTYGTEPLETLSIWKKER